MKIQEMLFDLLNDDFGIKKSAYDKLEELYSDVDGALDIFNRTECADGRVYLSDAYEFCKNYNEFVNQIKGESQ